jgi:hypothetical protein
MSRVAITTCAGGWNANPAEELATVSGYVWSFSPPTHS